MYYVLQVAPEEEDKTEALIMAILPKELYGECFHLTRHMRKKFHGKWMDMREKLLPGYVFITAEKVEKLFLELKRVPIFTNIVGRDGWNFSEMSAYEVEWLEKIRECSLKNSEINREKLSWYEVGMSQVDINQGNKIEVVSGPLKGIEGMVKKINLHKRIAEVEIPFMRKKTIIYLGIEFLKKK